MAVELEPRERRRARMKAVGIVMIAFGVGAAASAVSLYMQNEAQGAPPAERFGQAIGGALCSLTLVIGGFFVARGADREAAEKKRRPPSDGPSEWDDA